MDIFADVAAEFPVLSILKRLEMRLTSNDKSVLGLAASMLKACPALCEISFKLYDFYPLPVLEQPGVTISPHNSLKVVELVGFAGYATDVELALYLIRNASMLEKIIFDTRVPYQIGTPYEFRETEEKKNGRRLAERLVTKLRPGATSEII